MLGISPRSKKRELTNDLVSDIKAKLEKFKQNKINEINSTESTDNNFDISKDMLDKFKKSINQNKLF